MVDLIAYAAGVLLFIMSIPQIMKVRRYGSQGVSISTWLIVCAAIALWCVYGSQIGNGPLTWVNVVSIWLPVTTAALIAADRCPRWSFVSAFLAVTAALAVLAVVAFVWVPATVVVLTGTVLVIVSRVPQTVQSLRNWRAVKVTEVSVPAWSFGLSGQLLWAVYGHLIGDVAIIATNVVSSALTVVIIAVTLATSRRWKADNFPIVRAFPAAA
jgi:uncharacterized protein with PQ loop repeat